MNTAKINGYGAYFRFITPILVTIAIAILNYMRADIKELKTHFTNHLSLYQANCITVESRLKAIEVELKYKK